MSLRLIIALAICRAIDAAPGASRVREGVISPRATSDPSQPGGLTVQVWAPLVAVIVVIIVMILFSCIRRRKQTALSAAALASNRARANGSTTELTAELLSGSSGATTAENRRARRTRRTPSQISTRSLPAYMESPDDSEMVLVRGARDMEDPMPTVQEGDTTHNTSDSLGSLGDLNNTSQNSQTNLLNPESHLFPPERDARVSIDTFRSGSEDSNHALLQPSRHSRQPSAEEILAMGEAPPYFEVVGELDLAEGMEMQGMRSPIGASITPDVEQTAQNSPEVPTPEPSATTQSSHDRRTPSSASTVRRSGFRSFAARLSQFMPSSSSPAPTVSSGSPTEDRATTPSSPVHTRHRSTTSGSGSTLNLSPTLSRSHVLPHSRSIRSLRSSTSAVNLTSPSATSLGPISAPLPHTLVRTEFAYPKVGPTSEQMKFISSRETVGKFGVPYGMAAQAQALASREALAMPSDAEPPPFESPSAEAGPSAARSGSDDPSTSSPGAGSLQHPIVDPESSRLPSSRPTLELPGASASDTVSSRSSTRDSIMTFETAPEPLSSEDEHKHDEHSDDEVQSRSETPTPSNVPLTINVDGVASKSVPTPPPTPPRQSLALPSSDIPSITVLPASPAS